MILSRIYGSKQHNHSRQGFLRGIPMSGGAVTQENSLVQEPDTGTEQAAVVEQPGAHFTDRHQTDFARELSNPGLSVIEGNANSALSAPANSGFEQLDVDPGVVSETASRTWRSVTEFGDRCMDVFGDGLEGAAARIKRFVTRS